ncbi:hypothetical protein [Tenacibaculum larymnensis]|uniref:Lipoprotein n=1 Tax=Tenacibaculum larymnensis TaxID=2878201 RepID=A0A9X4IPJ0_9FLAO|nr:hypothetical protein [Tenacibaculum larymnensis]MDE1206022.1 hypothetical protein [Tenacibaculum larymnensis]
MKKYLASIMIAFLVSCGTSTKEETPKDNSKNDNSTEKVIQAEKEEELAKEKREEKKLEKLDYYLNNSFVTDENGISYKLKVVKTIIGQENMYTSKKMYVTKGDIGFDKYVVVSSYRIKTLFKLKSNGKIIENIELEGFLVKSQLNGDTKYNFWDSKLNKWVVKTKQDVIMLRNMSCNDSFIYYPQLDSKKHRKNRITEFTSVWCNFGIGDDVKNAKIEAINKCGMLEDNLKNIQYTTDNLLDINNVFKSN